jgi:heme uptake protein IsdC
LVRKLLFQFAVFMLVVMSASSVNADDPDGTFSIDYQVLNSDSDSVSIANDYFDKPATLFVENGEKYIQFSINHSEWVKELQAPLGESFVDVDIVSEDEEEDTRIVRFKLEEDLSEPVEVKMHILVESMEPVYDHRYSVRFDFEDDQMEEIDSAVASSLEEVNTDENKVVTDTGNEQQAGKSEKNGSKTIVLIAIVVGMAALLITRPWKTKRN